MIRSFKSREAEKIFSRQKSDLIPEIIQRIALRELRTLDQAPVAKDAWLPFIADPHGSSGNHASRYTIPVADKWRICFEWRDGHAYDVEIVDGECSS